MDSIDTAHVEILANKYLLAFSQDPVYGRSAHPYKWGYNPDWTFDPQHPAEYWSGPSSTLGGTLVLMLNSESANATRTAVWSEVPELRDGSRSTGKARGQSRRVVDVWSGKDLGCIHNEYGVELESHDIAALLVKERC